MYPGRMPMQGQPQGAYPMNTGPRAVDHAGYPMNHNMMTQGGQMGYRTTQSAMPGPNRMVGPFSSSVSPNAVVGANNNPQMISSMNAHPGTGQYPMGMMNRPQQLQQQQQQQQMQHQQQSMMGMSPNPGGMRMGAQNMGAHIGPISTSGDSTPFQPPISGNNMGMYNRSPNPGGSLMGQNSAVVAQAAGQKRNSLSPYQSQYRTAAAAAYSPNSTSPGGGPTQPPFQGTPPPPPSYNSSNNSLPSVNQASTYQVVPPNQTAPNNSNQLPLPNAAAAQEASNSPRSGPGTPTVATSTVHTHDLVTSQLSPLPVDATITATSSQKSSNTDLAASSQEVSNASQGSTPQVSQLFCMYILLHVRSH